MKNKVHTVEELKSEYFKNIETTRKPSPIPYNPRWLNSIYAFVNGYFWMPCPLCGKTFGGHEWYENNGAYAVCPECSIRIWNREVDEEKYNGKMNKEVWSKCKHGKWKDIGISKYYLREVECGKCGYTVPLACRHMGSLACEPCMARFLAKEQI